MLQQVGLPARRETPARNSPVTTTSMQICHAHRPPRSPPGPPIPPSPFRYLHAWPLAGCCTRAYGVPHLQPIIKKKNSPEMRADKLREGGEADGVLYFWKCDDTIVQWMKATESRRHATSPAQGATRSASASCTSMYRKRVLLLCRYISTGEFKVYTTDSLQQYYYATAVYGRSVAPPARD